MSLLYSQHNIGREQLPLLATPPALGRFHQPYSFHEYVTDVEEALDKIGLNVSNQEFEVTHENNRMFGVMEIADSSGDDWRFLLGLRGSHDQSVSRGISIGSQVLVCSNLCFSGDIGETSTKQTLRIGDRLPSVIQDIISRVPEIAQKQAEKFDRYKEMEVTTTRGNSMLTDLFRQGAMTSTQLGKAIREWDKPSYEEHKHADAGENTRSGWRLFNAVTQVQKGVSNHNTIMQRTEVLSKYMEGVINESRVVV